MKHNSYSTLKSFQVVKLKHLLLFKPEQTQKVKNCMSYDDSITA